MVAHFEIKKPDLTGLLNTSIDGWMPTELVWKLMMPSFMSIILAPRSTNPIIMFQSKLLKPLNNSSLECLAIL
jgi:hypothetical protein